MRARQLIIMRHATADPDGGRDHERRLTPQGLDEAHRVGIALAENGPTPQQVLCSSAIRCRETWDAVSAAFDARAAVDIEGKLYNASAGNLLHALAGVVDSEVVLLLAHNPGVSMLALELARGDETGLAQLRSGFAPASLALFEVENTWSALSSASARLLRFERNPDV